MADIPADKRRNYFVTQHYAHLPYDRELTGYCAIETLCRKEISVSHGHSSAEPEYYEGKPVPVCLGCAIVPVEDWPVMINRNRECGPGLSVF